MSKKKISVHPKGPGVWMPLSTLNSPAWKALSDGAQRLYISLKAEADNAHYAAYLSTRDAATALGRSRGGGCEKIREWYAELEHYGFIVMLSPGCLGTDGRGKAPHWKLTDKGTTRGGYEPATQDFLRWDGLVFDPKPYRRKSRWKTESRAARGGQGERDAGDSPERDAGAPDRASERDAGDICGEVGERHARDITSINHYPALPNASPKPDQTIVAPNDPKLQTNFMKRRA